ncbi:uncharacterized protein LOC132309915 [Cornus florida]|uniref:uncharacterized protein LOC132309915 n=1 Tax=Cornus florida TaxID=4283 RepID=UPI002899B1AC|nr:uncharacterized protein LOC132309915 [Cornus florida]
MSSVIASTAGIQVMLPLVRSEGQRTRQPKLFGSCPIGPRPLSMQFRPFDRRLTVSHAIRAKFDPVRWRPLNMQFRPFDRKRPASHVGCAATLNARCGAAVAEQTQTVKRQQSTIDPIQGMVSAFVTACGTMLLDTNLILQIPLSEEGGTDNIIWGASSSGKERPPQLDDGGTGLPPHDGSGGGGGGGGDFSGGFFLFAFLAFMGFLKDKEREEDEYGDNRKRRENYL